MLKELKADPNTKDIPVAMISIVGDEDIGYSLGAVDHLVKPVDREQLRRLAGQSRARAVAAMLLSSTTTKRFVHSSGEPSRRTAGASTRPRMV